MPKHDPDRQSSFSAGVLSPDLHGRTDISRYSSGVRDMLNFEVTPHGVLKNRVGTLQVASFIGSDARLFPFIYAEDDTAILVFTNNEINAVKRPAAADLRFGPWPTTALVSINSGYLAADLAGLKFAQVGDFVYIVSPSHPPKRVERLAGGNFVLRSISLVVPEFPDTSDLTATEVPFPSLGYDLPDTQSGVTYSGLFKDRAYLALSVYKDVAEVPGEAPEGATGWDWQMTCVVEDSKGRVFETLPKAIAHATVYDEVLDTTINSSGITSVITRDYTGYISLPDNGLEEDVQTIVVPFSVFDTAEVQDSSGVKVDDVTILSTRIYRGYEGRYGRVAEGTGNVFKDPGGLPDFSVRPPSGDSKFDAAGDYPAAITFYEGRLVLAGTDNNPGTFWASATDEWSNFDRVPDPRAGSALFAELASNKHEFIKALVPRSKLLILTNSAEWTLAGSGEGEILTPNSIAARQMSQYGSGKLAPLEVGPSVFVAQMKGTVPRVLAPGSNQNGFDISIFARHLFEGYTIIDWAYAEDPHAIVWAVRSDGALLSLTYLPEQEMIAWAQHTLAGDGTAVSVAVVPEGTEDGVYVAVNYAAIGGAGAGVRLERFSHRNLPIVSGVKDPRFAVHLDRAVAYDGSSAGTTATLTLADGANVAVYQYLGGSFIDVSTEATDASSGDFEIMGTAAEAVVGDAVYFGFKERVRQISLDNANGAAGSSGSTVTVVWEYSSDGVTWTPLDSVVDGTSNFTAAVADNQVVSWTRPASWDPFAITGVPEPYFWVRARLSVGSWDIVDPLYDQMRIKYQGDIGDTITAVFDGASLPSTGEEVQIANPDDGLPVRLTLGTESPSGTFVATVDSAPGDGVTATVPASLLSKALTDWGTPITSKSSMSHLEGQTVSVVADGQLVTGLVVSAGSVSWGFPAEVVIAGLPYDSDFESLDAEAGRERQKSISHVTYELGYTRGGQVGEELGDDMQTILTRKVSSNYIPVLPARLEDKVAISSSWNRGGRIAIRQSEPFPMTILGFTRHVVRGGS